MRHFVHVLRSLAPVALAVAGCGPEAPVDSSTPHNVFGTDDRVEIRDAQYPYSSMGRLQTGCTGTLVGRRLVLTAAHCVITTGSGAVKADVKQFEVGVVGGQARDKAWIQHIWFGTKVPEGTGGERGKDWAILKLDKPLGDTHRYLDVEVPDLSSLPFATNLGGYSIDRDNGGTLSAHKGCSIREIKGERLLHDCDAKSGVSGAAMFRTGGDRAKIGAISVSEYRNGASQSVDAPAYAAEVANVAISAQAFEPTLKALLQSVDGGGAAPNLPGILSAANPNAPDPTDPIDPPPTGDDVRATQLISMSEVRTHLSSLKRSATLALDSANLASQTAYNYGEDALRRSALDASAGAAGVQTALEQATSTSSDSTTPGRIASALTSLSRARTKLNTQIASCRTAHYCAELRAYVSNVASATDALRARLIRR